MNQVWCLVQAVNNPGRWVRGEVVGSKELVRTRSNQCEQCLFPGGASIGVNYSIANPRRGNPFDAEQLSTIGRLIETIN